MNFCIPKLGPSILQYLEYAIPAHFNRPSLLNLARKTRTQGLTKYPRRALHLSGSDARFGGVHFSGPPHFGPLGDFFWFFFAKFGFYGPKLL